MQNVVDYKNTELVTRYITAFTDAANHWRTGRKTTALATAMERRTELADEITRRAADQMGLIEADRLAGRHVAGNLSEETLNDEVARIAGLLN